MEDNGNPISSPAPLTPEVVKPKPRYGLAILIGVLSFFFLASLVAASYFYTQNQQLKKLAIVAQPTPPLQPSVTLVKEAPSDPTAGWQTYTGKNFTFKYPPQLTHQKDQNDIVRFTDDSQSLYLVLDDNLNNEYTKPVGNEFHGLNNITTTLLNQIEGFIIVGENGMVVGPTGKKQKEAFVNSNGKALIFGCETNNVCIDGGLDQILSTFKFTDEIKPTASSTSYKPGSGWQTVNNPTLGISVCLPPKWEFGDLGKSQMSGEIFYARDPQYRPNASAISSYPYNGGSRRDEYINLKTKYEYEPEKLKGQTTVKEVTINGKSFLAIAIPSFPEVLVTAIDDKLYAIDIDYDPMVNDSEAAFRKDIQTIAGCLKQI